MKPIQEFSDEDLVEELMERFDDIVIAGRKILTNFGDQKTSRRRWWKGDMDACTGLAQGLSSDLINKTWGINGDDIND